jgi:catalytic LigB subunit of aromatic ring-opening dioxygenase
MYHIMAKIVLGIGTSHTPLLSLPPEMWPEYAKGDERNPELSFPPHGYVMSFPQAVETLKAEGASKYEGPEPFNDQSARFKTALDTLASTLQEAEPDVTVIISDDQDEWFYEHNMPRFAVYWGESAPLIPRSLVDGASDMAKRIAQGYGDLPMDVPVASRFGRYLVEYLGDHDFDVAHLTHVQQPYGGRVARRYPTPDGELNSVRETRQHEQGLPHGFAFIVKRLFNNQPRPIVPVFQNTCYPPNQPSARRSYQFGKAIGEAIKAWDGPERVAVIASGGLSHFVVDEELDRKLLTALEKKDASTLQALPKERLYSATSESLNWIAVAGAMEKEPLKFDLVDYVPVYRTPANTGGGWAFGRWQ